MPTGETTTGRARQRKGGFGNSRLGESARAEEPLEGKGGEMAKKSTEEVLADPDFKQLYSQRRNIAWTLTVLELALFYGFVWLVSYHKPFLSQKLGSGSATTIGIPIAVGVILLSWVFTGIYVRWANTTYDGLVKKVKDKIGG